MFIVELVWNKDIMVIELFRILIDFELLIYLEFIKDMFLIISIFLDRYRVIDINKRGMYEYFYVFCLVSNGILYFLIGIWKLDY